MGGESRVFEEREEREEWGISVDEVRPSEV